MLKIIVAPDSFKGSLTAKEAANKMAIGIYDVLPNALIFQFPIADGGEGTTECLVDAVGGRIITKEVTGPLGTPVTGFFGILDPGHTAIIEVASGSGLCLVPSAERNPLSATSYGTGELIRTALDEGCAEIFIGLGGSATNDAGAGILQALGGRLLDDNGNILGRGAKDLKRLSHIDLSQIDERLNHTKITLICDVNNPLCGSNGASVVYGPQKGATPQMVKTLDLALAQFARVCKALGKDVANIPGAGAAGGIGAGLSLLGATITPGLNKILELTGMEKVLANGVDLVITGEGEFNFQSFHGKVPVGVAQLAKKYNIPVVVLTGNISGNAIDCQAYKKGIDAILTIAPGPIGVNESIANAGALLRNAASRAMRLIKVGLEIK